MAAACSRPTCGSPSGPRIPGSAPAWDGLSSGGIQARARPHPRGGRRGIRRRPPDVQSRHRRHRDRLRAGATTRLRSRDEALLGPPRGGLGWLYTWQAIVIGDVLLAFPIAVALSAAAVQGVDPRIRRSAETLGAGLWRTGWTVAREARFALAAVLTAAFGQVVAEVGAAMIVGGNIRGSTRTLTTAVALHTAQGDFGLALALGLILLLLALLVNVALQALQGRGHA